MTRNEEMINLILSYYQTKNWNINVKDNSGWTPLHIAVYYASGRHTDDIILKKLLDYPGIEVDVENSDSNTPLV